MRDNVLRPHPLEVDILKEPTQDEVEFVPVDVLGVPHILHLEQEKKCLPNNNDCISIAYTSACKALCTTQYGGQSDFVI